MFHAVHVKHGAGLQACEPGAHSQQRHQLSNMHLYLLSPVLTMVLMRELACSAIHSNRLIQEATECAPVTQCSNQEHSILAAVAKSRGVAKRPRRFCC